MISYAWAAEAAEQAPQSSIASFVPLILIFIIFYFFIIRPQTKKQKEQQLLINSLKKGDKVIIAGGIVGKISKISEDEMVEVEIAKSVQIQALKSTITSLSQEKTTKKK